MTQKLVQLVNGGLETNILRLSSNEHLSGMLNLRIRKGLSEKGDWIWKEEYKLRNGGKKKRRWGYPYKFGHAMARNGGGHLKGWHRASWPPFKPRSGKVIKRGLHFSLWVCLDHCEWMGQGKGKKRKEENKCLQGLKSCWYVVVCPARICSSTLLTLHSEVGFFSNSSSCGWCNLQAWN